MKILTATAIVLSTIFMISGLVVFAAVNVANAQESPMCNGLTPTIVITSTVGDIFGTDNDDIFLIQSDGNTIFGYNGNDTICVESNGPLGNYIKSGPDNDIIFSQNINDIVQAQSGDNDICNIYQGTSTLNCESVIFIDPQEEEEMSEDPPLQLLIGQIILTDAKTGAVITDTVNLNPTIEISTTVQNLSGPARTINMLVEIQDVNGVEIQDAKTQTKLIDAAQTVGFEISMRTQIKGDVNLIVSFELSDENGRRVVNTSTFPLSVITLSESFLIQNARITDNASPPNTVTQLSTGDVAIIRLEAVNDQSIPQSFFREVTVTKPGGAPIVSDTVEGTLQPQGIDNRTISALNPLLEPGTHTATITYFTDNTKRTQLATTTLSVDVAGEIILTETQRIEILEQQVTDLEIRITDLERRLAAADIP